MPPTQAFGADVRSLRPQGFTFVLLPAEENIPSGDALLPMLENGKKHHFTFFSVVILTLLFRFCLLFICFIDISNYLLF